MLSFLHDFWLVVMICHGIFMVSGCFSWFLVVVHVFLRYFSGFKFFEFTNVNDATFLLNH